MSDYTYPIPPEPAPDWARFLRDLWFHGLTHPDPEQMQRHVGNVHLLDALVGTAVRKKREAQVRPSALLSCQRQAWLLLQGHEPEPMSQGLAPSFAIGHLIEAMTRAFLYGALPPGFALSHDTRVPLPSWWPTAHPSFAAKGTNDFTIRVTDRAMAAQYLDLERSRPVCMFDLKTSGIPAITKYAKEGNLSDSPDGFGYNSQLAVYGAGNPEECDVCLMVFNRNSPMQGVVVRRLKDGERAEEAHRLATGFEMALANKDPGLEFQQRWGKSGKFYCDQFCSMREHCKATPVAYPEMPV